MTSPFFRKFAQSAKTFDKKMKTDKMRLCRERKSPLQCELEGGSCAGGYFANFCMKRMRMVATCARLAVAFGFSLLLEP